MARELKVGATYRHFKNKLYKVLGTAIHSGDGRRRWSFTSSSTARGRSTPDPTICL